MMKLVGLFQVIPRDVAPAATAPARAVRCLDLEHLRSREIGLTAVLEVVLHRAWSRSIVFVARAARRRVQLTSWWDRTVRALAGDAMRQPAAAVAVPPRSIGALRGTRSDRVSLRPVGLAARLEVSARV